MSLSGGAAGLLREVSDWYFDLYSRLGLYSTDHFTLPSSGGMTTLGSDFETDSDTSHHQPQPFQELIDRLHHWSLEPIEADSPVTSGDNIDTPHTVDSIPDTFSIMSLGPQVGMPSFSGRAGQSAADYIEDVETFALLSRVSDEAQLEQVRKTIFRTGLSAKAKRWYDSDLPRALKGSWENICTAFLTKFPEPCGEKADVVTISDIVNFERKVGEQLSAYIKRADKMRRKIGDNDMLLRILTDRLLSKMTDGEVDSDIKKRVEDRLVARDMLPANCRALKDDCTYSDVRDTIVGCIRSYGEDNSSDFSDTEEDEEEDANSIPKKVLRDLTQALSSLAVQRTAEVNTSSNTAGRDKSRQTSSTNNYNGTSDSKPRSFSKMTCFNCGKTGHPSRECDQPSNPEAQQKRWKEFEKNRAAREKVQSIISSMDPEHLQSLIDLTDNGIEKSEGNLNFMSGSGGMSPKQMETLNALNSEVDTYTRSLMAAARSDKGKEKENTPSDNTTSGRVVKPKTRILVRDKLHPKAAEEVDRRVRFEEVSDSEDDVMHEEAVRYPSSSPSTVDQEVRQSSLPPPPEASRSANYEAPPVQQQDKTPPALSLPLRKPMPMRGMVEQNHAEFDLGKFFSEVRVPISLLQLMAWSPRIRAESHRITQPAVKTKRGRKGNNANLQAHPLMSLSLALDAEDTPPPSVGYVEAKVNGTTTRRAMLDNGSTVDVISPQFASKLGVEVRHAPQAWVVRLANDQRASLSKFVVLEVEVAGVMCVMFAFIFGASETYDLLLSQSWYYRVQAVQDWGTQKLLLKDRDGHQSETVFFPHDFASPLIVRHPEEEDVVREDFIDSELEDEYHWEFWNMEFADMEEHELLACMSKAREVLDAKVGKVLA